MLNSSSGWRPLGTGGAISGIDRDERVQLRGRWCGHPDRNWAEAFKWAQLQKRGVEYVKTRDFESLADTFSDVRENVRQLGQMLAETSEQLGSDRAPGAELGADLPQLVAQIR